MNEKNITINILPQDPFAWLFIAMAVVLTAVAIGGINSKEGEKTRRLDMMMRRGITNAQDIATIEKSFDNQ